MAAKPKTPKEITAEDIAAKRKATNYTLSEAQCRAVLEAQAEHDATDPHDAVPKERVI